MIVVILVALLVAVPLTIQCKREQRGRRYVKRVERAARIQQARDYAAWYQETYGKKL